LPVRIVPGARRARADDCAALAATPDHGTRVHGAMIRQLDRRIGDVLQVLRDKGIEDDTLVFFTRDSGGAR
jgi:arylsulfatase A-like enzyme